MKFEYDKKKNQPECVAFTWNSHLHLKCSDGGTVLFATDVAADPGFFFMSENIWQERLLEAGQKFYPGDSITITF